MANSIEVDVSVQAEAAKAWMDGKTIRLASDGTGTATVQPGQHAFSFAVRGAAGTKYTAKITAPASAKYSHTDTFDDAEFDQVIHWFTV
jgi:hypothetical protein